MQTEIDQFLTEQNALLSQQNRSLAEQNALLESTSQFITDYLKLTYNEARAKLKGQNPQLGTQRTKRSTN